MSEMVERAAKAVAEEWQRWNHGEPYTKEAPALARAALLAALITAMEQKHDSPRYPWAHPASRVGCPDCGWMVGLVECRRCGGAGFLRELQRQSR